MTTMKYLMCVIDDQTGSATDAEMDAIAVFNERLRLEGHWVLAAGLRAPAASTTFDNRGGKALVTEGPFAETAEYVSGIWIIDVPSEELALERAAEGSKACNRKVELRPFL
jgi:hypothetical protein